MKEKCENSYYPEIMNFLKAQIESNFSAAGKDLKVYCKTGELKAGLFEIISENNINTPSILKFASGTPKLSLDIFALVTDGKSFQLLIIEVKLLKSVGLQQLSQLIGYCIVGRSGFGLLVNVNGTESPRLTELLQTDPDLLTIKQRMSDGTEIDHQLGVMEWDPDTKNILYTGYGPIGSVSKLCKELSKKF